jgi:hypothetical protein
MKEKPFQVEERVRVIPKSPTIEELWDKIGTITKIDNFDDCPTITVLIDGDIEWTFEQSQLKRLVCDCVVCRKYTSKSKGLNI